MRFAVAIHAVCESHDPGPTTGLIAVLATAAISNHERVLFEIVNRGAHRRAMRGHHTRSVFGVDREQYRSGTRCGDHDVVAEYRGALGRPQHFGHATRITRVARAA